MIGAEPIDYRRFEFLQPYVQGWVGKLEKARASKQWFTEIGKECMIFYSGTAQQFWDPTFLGKYVQGSLQPKFKMIMAKAFEFVALAGPTLFWSSPQRIVTPKKRFQMDESTLQHIPDQGLQQMLQFIMQSQESSRAVEDIRAWLLETVLNYTPTEQPGGGLAAHSMLGIIEALVKGRGCSWTETFQPAGSGRTLTGSFFRSVDNLLIDPDAESFDGADWIACERFEPYWKVERKFQWPSGSLRQAANFESANYQGQALENMSATGERQMGQSQDCIRYYEIYSKCGPGSRLSGVSTPIAEHMEQVVGDYAYIAITPKVPCPLNCRSDRLRGNPSTPGATDDEVRKMFRWPVPTWTDGRWPCSVLDLYPKPRSAWPIPPIGPGIGELVFLNTFSSHMANRLWSSTRDFIVIMERAADRIEEIMRSGDDLAIIKLKEAHGKIDELVQFVKQPEFSADGYHVLQMMGERFADRVGLPDVFYAKNPGGKMPRTATDIESRKGFANIRVDYMADQVESWQETIARNELLALRHSVRAQDLDGLYGPAEMLLYERLIEQEPFELVVREMHATITAGSARKPNREKDTQNINATVATMLPAFLEYAAATGDSGPANAYLRLWLKSIEMDGEGMQLGPWQAQPPPGADQQMELEQQQMQAEMQGQQLDLQGKQIDMQSKLAQAQAKADQQRMDMQKAVMDLYLKQQQGAMQLEAQEDQHEQTMQHEQQRHLLEMVRSHQAGQQKLQQGEAQGKAKVALMRRQAAAKPKPKPKAKSAAKARR